MSRRRKRGGSAPPQAIPFADWLPPESGPNKYYPKLLFAQPEGGTGALCIVGRELQLVWYASEKDRDKDRNGKLVCVLEFQDCWKTHDRSGPRYHFSALLLEDMSGEYRDWVRHQQHAGRPFRQDTEVLETHVEFSVAVQPTGEDPFAAQAPVSQPFLIHEPDVENLSSPQLDMLFDVMSFLYQSIPAMELMEQLRRQQADDSASKPGASGASNRLIGSV